MLTKKQIDKNFITEILPAIKQRYELDNIKDKPARREAYNNYIDYLCKGKQITESKANVYIIPKNLIN